jgi:hypothetical protein
MDQNSFAIRPRERFKPGHHRLLARCASYNRRTQFLAEALWDFLNGSIVEYAVIGMDDAQDCADAF